MAVRGTTNAKKLKVCTWRENLFRLPLPASGPPGVRTILLVDVCFRGGGEGGLERKVAVALELHREESVPE